MEHLLLFRWRWTWSWDPILTIQLHSWAFIFSQDWKSHLCKVQAVLDSLCDTGPTINSEKCAIGFEKDTLGSSLAERLFKTILDNSQTPRKSGDLPASHKSWHISWVSHTLHPFCSSASSWTSIQRSVWAVVQCMLYFCSFLAGVPIFYLSAVITMPPSEVPQWQRCKVDVPTDARSQ